MIVGLVPNDKGGFTFAVGLVLILVSLALVFTEAAHAEDRPQLSRQGCEVAADMVLVARSLSAAGIERDKAGEIMALVYADLADGGAIDKLRVDLTDFGYRRTETPVDVGKAFALLCMQHRGTLDQVLGSAVRWRF